VFDNIIEVQSHTDQPVLSKILLQTRPSVGFCLMWKMPTSADTQRVSEGGLSGLPLGPSKLK